MHSPILDEETHKTSRSTKKWIKASPLLIQKGSLVRFANSKSQQSATLSDKVKEEKGEEEVNIDTKVVLKPFPPISKADNALRKVVIADDKLDLTLSFSQKEDREVPKSEYRAKTSRPQRRELNQIALLQRAFEEIKFFKEVKPQMDEISYNKIFQAMTIECYEPGQRVFNIDDIGRKFFIIIEGSVYVLIRSQDDVPNIEQHSLPTGDIDDQGDKIINIKEVLEGDHSENMKEMYVEGMQPGLKIVKTLLEGESFGEIALTRHSDGRRTAAVVSREKTVVGILTNNDYQTILGNFYERRYQEKVDMLSNIDIFKNWTTNFLSALTLNMEEVKFNRKQTIFKEGEPGDAVYFIKSGEVELMKSVHKEEFEERKPRNQKSKKSGLKTRQPKKREVIKLGILMERDYFGATQLVYNSLREYSAVVYSSEATLLKMNKDRFFGFVKNEKSLSYLNEHINKKKAWRDDMIRNFVNINTVLDHQDTQESEERRSTSRLNKNDLPQSYFTQKNRAGLSTNRNVTDCSLEDAVVMPHLPKLETNSSVNKSYNPSATFFNPASKMLSRKQSDKEALESDRGLVRYVSGMKSQKKNATQIYTDHMKWIEETLGGNSLNNSELDDKQSYDAEEDFSLNFVKGLSQGIQSAKLKPLKLSERLSPKNKMKQISNNIADPYSPEQLSSSRLRFSKSQKKPQNIQTLNLNTIGSLSNENIYSIKCSPFITQRVGKELSKQRKENDYRKVTDILSSIPSERKNILSLVRMNDNKPSSVRSILATYRKSSEQFLNRKSNIQKTLG